MAVWPGVSSNPLTSSLQIIQAMMLEQRSGLAHREQTEVSYGALASVGGKNERTACVRTASEVGLTKQ